MEDRVDSAQRLVDRGAIADVADDELDVLGEVLGPSPSIAVHLRLERVEHADAVAAREQLVGEVRADEPGAARDQHFLHRGIPVLLLILMLGEWLYGWGRFQQYFENGPRLSTRMYDARLPRR